MRYQGIQFPDTYLKLTIRYDLCFVRWLPSKGETLLFLHPIP
jgi:hypothetical protein